MLMLAGKRCDCLVLLLAAILTGCGGGGGSAPTPPSKVAVVATDPPDGAQGVQPDTAIRIVLSDDSPLISASDVIVSDGGNQLPGTLSQGAEAGVWIWTPDYELPRGCQVQVALDRAASEGAVTSFRVRDTSITREFEIYGEVPEFSLSWPNGRRALVTASGRVFEVTADLVVERFVAVFPGARAYGDGDFICEQVEGGMRYCVRGNLDGTSDRVPTPFGVAIGENNMLGDVVACVPPTVATPLDWGLWRLLRGDSEFSFAGSVIDELIVDVPSIQSDGTVSVAYARMDRVRLSRFAIDNPAGEHHEIMVEAGSPHFDSGDDGRGVLAFATYTAATATTVPRVGVKLARYEPGDGLRVLPGEAYAWDIYLGATTTPFQRIDDVRVGDQGSACLVLADGLRSPGFGLPGGGPLLPIVNTNYRVVRIEPDDRMSSVLNYMFTIGQEPERSLAAITPMRAELWSLSDFLSPGRFLWIRSRPDEVRTSELYKSGPSIVPWGAWCFSFDDSGRGLMALTEGFEQVTSIRVLLVN